MQTSRLHGAMAFDFDLIFVRKLRVLREDGG